MAVSGTLDPAFGTAGKVVPVTHTIADMVVLPTGHVLVGGSIAGTGTLEKRAPDGSLDSSFGSNGVVARGAIGLALDAGGFLYVGNFAGLSWQVSKLDSRGQPVAAFGNAGDVVIPPLTDGLALFVRALLPDGTGNLYGVGTARDLAAGTVLILLKMDAGGAMVPSFGQGGVRIAALFGFGEVSGLAAALDSRGNLVVAAREQAEPGRLLVMKLDATGAPVGGFGAGGRVEIACGGDRAGSFNAAGVLVDAQDNVFVASGCRDAQSIVRARVVKLGRDGRPAAGFGDGGTVPSVFQEAGTRGSDARALALDAAGALYVGGRVFMEGTAGFVCSDASIAKLDSSGRSVGSFGTGGVALFDLGPSGGLDSAEHIALDASGRIYVAASARSCTDLRPSITPFVLLRLLP